MGLSFSLCSVEGIIKAQIEWMVGSGEKSQEPELQWFTWYPLYELGKGTRSEWMHPHECAARPVDGTFGLIRKIYPF